MQKQELAKKLKTKEITYKKELSKEGGRRVEVRTKM